MNSSYLDSSRPNREIDERARNRDPSFIQKRESIRKMLDEIDTNGDSLITRDELYTFLKNHSDGSFNRTVVNEMFETFVTMRNRTDPNNPITVDDISHITIEEFLEVYLEHEGQLKENLEDIKLDLQRMRTHREETKLKLQEAHATEKKNVFNIMEDSLLHVTVNGAKALKPLEQAASCDPYCILTLDRQKLETPYIKSSVNPEWKETFTFDVWNPNDSLKLVVMNHDIFGNDEFSGQIVIEMSELMDQKKHEGWYNLRSQDSEELMPGKIGLTLQFIHSGVDFLTENVYDWDVQINEKNQEMALVERKLKLLYDPFSHIMEKQSWLEPQKKIKEIETKFAFQFENIARGSLGRANIEWYPLTRFLARTFLILSILIGFNRPNMLDTLLAGSILLYLLEFPIDSIPQNVYKAHATGLAISIVWDLLWVLIFIVPWMKGEQWDGGLGNGMRRFTAFLSIISFCFKFVFGLVMWKNSTDYYRFEMERRKNQGV
mmetsp:Transcript_63642/g.72955  ORF Transcript_63642/g.72955 Transcript_63642/m.72955 type:complete len:491 (-) Transcript_63642:433-1905(-)